MGANLHGRFLQFLTLFIIGFFLFSSSQKIYAAGAGIKINPASGVFTTGKTFTADVVVDGGGTAFNAVKANVNIPSNLSIQNIVMGNCGFAFVVTPTVSNPSFTGVILGGSSTNCTVYTLDLKFNSGGSADISISGASIKSFKGAQEISSYSQGAAFSSSTPFTVTTFPTIPIEPTLAPIVGKNGARLYDVALTVVDSNGQPLPNAEVILDPISKSGETANNPNISQQTAFTDANGKVIFAQVSQGIHSFQVNYNNQQIAQNILNVSGKNREVVLGITKQNKNFPIWWLLLPFCVVVLVFIIYAIVRYT